jgi:hypothetical protein
MNRIEIRLKGHPYGFEAFNSDGLRTFRQHFYGLKFITDEFPHLILEDPSFPQ